MTDRPAEEQLRTQIRDALTYAKISQAEACRRLGLSTKHLNTMLTGKATLTLEWAERLAGLCQARILLYVTTPAGGPDRVDRIKLDDLTSADLDELYDDLDRYAEVVGELNEANTTMARDLAELRQVARGYCPACGRGDAAPTVEDWERERQRAEQAEAKVADYENRISWATNCGSCARILDSSIRETERRERAEAALARAREVARWARRNYPGLTHVNDRLTTALDHPAPDTAATCGAHDGPCFPDPTTTCVAHGSAQCAHCHRNPADCIDHGQCSTCTRTGMHWDTCPNRVRGPLAPDTAATQATDEAACDAYQPPTTPADSGLCARCGMYDYRHHAKPVDTAATEAGPALPAAPPCIPDHGAAVYCPGCAHDDALAAPEPDPQPVPDGFLEQIAAVQVRDDEAALAKVQADLAESGVDTPGCDCGHDGMGARWHARDCWWRSIPPCDVCGVRGHSFEDCPDA